MDIYVDAMALFQQSDVQWVECKPPKEEVKEHLRLRLKAISKREQKRQETLRQLKEQQPPLPPEEILIKKEAVAIGEFRSWDSCSVPLTVVANREQYADGHKELWFLIDTKELNQKTLPHIRQQLLPSDNYIIVNYQNYYGLFSPFELIGFVVKLSEEARKKIAAECERFRRELESTLMNPRPP
jgi:hypothetical protein